VTAKFQANAIEPARARQLLRLRIAHHRAAQRISTNLAQIAAPAIFPKRLPSDPGRASITAAASHRLIGAIVSPGIGIQANLGERHAICARLERSWL
jgi:hypothetical protein